MDVVALLLSLGLGAACRYFGIPLPAPDRFVGVLLVVAMTLGFRAADLVIAHGSFLPMAAK